MNPLRSASSRVADSLLEASVAGSFTRLGYDARARMFGWSDLPDMTGKTVVITGATSGLGRAAALRLAGLNADLVVIGRDRIRTQHAADQIGATGTGSVEVIVADMSELGSVSAACERLVDVGRIDVLIHNAGALLERYTTTSEGFETTYACHVLGPFLMTHELTGALAAAPGARVITVTSGGMYTERLRPDQVQLTRGNYDGLRAYARAKRAQVVLNQEWAKKYPEVAHFHAVHPGWADTPGVVDSLPRFHRLMGPFLRTADQGADTMCWLAADPQGAASSGRLWLDRAPRLTNKVPWTVTGEAEARELWRTVVRDTGC